MPVSENCNVWITCESGSSIDFPWVFFFLVCCCLGVLFVFYFVLLSVLWSCFLICLIISYFNVWEISSVYNSTENFFFFLEDRELRDHSDPGKVSLFLVSPCPSAWSSRSPKWKLQLITSFPLHTHTILNSNLSPLNTVTSPSLLSFLDFCIYFLLILSAFHSKHVLLRMWQMTRGKTTGRILGSISYSTLSSKISLLKSWLP